MKPTFSPTLGLGGSIGAGGTTGAAGAGGSELSTLVGFDSDAGASTFVVVTGTGAVIVGWEEIPEGQGQRVGSIWQRDEQMLLRDPGGENLFGGWVGEVFGPEVGAHARSAFGVAQIPLGACVEIELIAELK